MATFEQARDDMQQAFWDAWRAGAPGVVGSVPEVRFEGIGKPQGDPPPADACWGRASIRHSSGYQAAFGTNRFTKMGIITISVFCPLNLEGGLRAGERLAAVAKSAFEGKSTPRGIWFRSVRIIEAGLDGPWYQFNILAEFVYDE